MTQDNSTEALKRHLPPSLRMNLWYTIPNDCLELTPDFNEQLEAATKLITSYQNHLFSDKSAPPCRRYPYETATAASPATGG